MGEAPEYKRNSSKANVVIISTYHSIPSHIRTCRDQPLFGYVKCSDTWNVRIREMFGYVKQCILYGAVENSIWCTARILLSRCSDNQSTRICGVRGSTIHDHTSHVHGTKGGEHPVNKGEKWLYSCTHSHCLALTPTPTFHLHTIWQQYIYPSPAVGKSTHYAWKHVSNKL
jgi:hypothetical protein